MNITAWAALIHAAEAIGKDVVDGVRGLLPQDTTDEQLNAINAETQRLALADAADARARAANLDPA